MRTYHKDRRISILLGYLGDATDVGHFLDNSIVRLHRILTDYFQFETFFLRNVLRIAHGAYSLHDAFNLLKRCQDLRVFSLRLRYILRVDHDAFSRFTLCQVLPKFFGNKRHKRVEQM